jgi:glycine cleavage system protein P-like pyridoxal-binding family
LHSSTAKTIETPSLLAQTVFVPPTFTRSRATLNCTADMMNTLKYAQRLEAAGFSRSQAEAQALVIQDALDDSMQPFATKADLTVVATKLEATIDRLDTKIDRVELALGSSIKELRSDMCTVKWMLGLMAPVLITLLIPAIQSIYLQLHAN